MAYKIKETNMILKRFFLTSFILIWCIGSVFAIDYSKYKYEQFAIPRYNPAYLIIPGGNAAEIPLTKIEGNKWVFPLGPFWYVTLPQAVLDKILRAKDNKDNFILFYQRKGAYVDISKYTGTSDADLIRRDRQGQMEYIEAITKAYTFVADDILTYSEIMSSVSKDMQTVLLSEENRSEENAGMKIFLAFSNGQINGARNYVNNRIRIIETENAKAQAERDARAREIAAEEQRRQDERRSAENRVNMLKNAMIMDYKPCFNIDGSNNDTPYKSYPKIAVVGYVENGHDNQFTVKPINYNNNQRENLSIIVTPALINLFPIISTKPRYGSYRDNTTNSYYSIFFLTQSNKNGLSYYTIDSYIFLGDIVGKTKESAGRADVKQTFLEDWILTNNGKQNIQSLNIITAVIETESTNQQQNQLSTTKPPTQDTTSPTAVTQELTKQEPIAKRTVNGYEVCFNIGGNPEPTPYKEFSKIIVVGYFYNSYNNNFQIRTYNYNRNQKENIKLVVSPENKNVFDKIVRQGYTDTSYFCIFFLSKLENGDYKVDLFTDYSEIIGKDKNSVFANDVSKSVLEGWIAQNHDK
jgi:hypothetical protein